MRNLKLERFLYLTLETDLFSVKCCVLLRAGGWRDAFTFLAGALAPGENKYCESCTIGAVSPDVY